MDPIAPTALAPGTGGAERAEDRLREGAAAGDYVVDRHIGAGAMGDVYAGHHPVIGKRVAIKVLKRALADQSEAATRFLREARAVNHVDHPGVVDVFAIGRLDDGRLFLVMDLLDGRSLRDRLRAGPVPPAVAMRILGEIAAALDAAHGKGVVHRDLKPDNVMLTGPDDAPTAHVLDFGIARLVAGADPGGGARTLETLTGQGAWLGTPAYMAPEQWSADGATAASDRYALGVIAYELMSGRPPFAGSSVVAMMEQHFRAPVPAIVTDGKRRPAVDRVLATALAKEPGARYASGAALVAALESALGEAPARARAPVGRAGWIAGGAAAVVVVAGVVVVGTGRGRDRARPAASAAVRTADDALIEIATTPPGARVIESGQDRGATPMVLPAAPGREVTFELVRPGYVSARRTVTTKAGEPQVVNVALAMVSGFEGVWALPDGAGLRAFERRGEQIAGFTMKAPGAPREFLRFFELVPATAGVAFGATEPFVDERAPEEPSCNIPLRAEYRYDPAGDRLELRRERAQYELVGGRCQLTATAWSEARPLARVAGAPADAVWAESRAGAGPVNAAQVNDAAPANGDEPVAKEPPGKKNGPKQAPTAKQVPPKQLLKDPGANVKDPPAKAPPPVKGAQAPGNKEPATTQADNNDDVGATMKKSAAAPQQPAPPPQQATQPAPQQAQVTQSAVPSPQAPSKPGSRK